MNSRHRAPLESRAHVPAAGGASDVDLMPAGDVTGGVVRVGGVVRRRGDRLEPHAGRLLAALARCQLAAELTPRRPGS